MGIGTVRKRRQPIGNTFAPNRPNSNISSISLQSPTSSRNLQYSSPTWNDNSSFQREILPTDSWELYNVLDSADQTVNATQFVVKSTGDTSISSLNTFLEEDTEDDALTYRSSVTTLIRPETIYSSSSPSVGTEILSTISQYSTCSWMTLAKEFAQSLNWPETLFDSSHDRCYCTNCYPSEWSDTIITGNATYVIPRGWIRLGLRVDPIHSDEHDIWNKWIVTFHGTTLIAARSVLTHRQFYLPGDKLIDGTILGIRDGHIPDKKFIFTSPTIAYSSSNIYSTVYDFDSTIYNTTYEAQIVLQCRQQPNSFTIQAETIRAGLRRICPYIENSCIEYYTDIRASIIAYGLLVRLRPKQY